MHKIQLSEFGFSVCEITSFKGLSAIKNASFHSSQEGANALHSCRI